MPCPALVPAVSLLLGAVAGSLFRPQPALLAILLTVAWIAALQCLYLNRPFALLAAVALGFLTGGAVLGLHASDRALHSPLRSFFDEHFAHRQQVDVDPVILEGRLREDAVPGESGVTLNLLVLGVRQEETRHETTGGVRLFVGGSLAQTQATEWRAGRLLRVPAILRRAAPYLNPGVADQERSLARRGISLLGSVKSGALIEVVELGSPMSEAAGRLRYAIRRIVTRTVGPWSPQSAAIVTAILIGDRAGLSRDLIDRLQRAGTYHVMAISGGNIAILAGLLLILLRSIRLRPRMAFMSAIGCLAAYSYLVGGGASVIRATLMAIAVFSARAGDHRTPPLNAAAIAAIFAVCATPLVAFDVGFALTFGATIGILVRAFELTRLLRRPFVRFGLGLREGRWIDLPLTLLAATVCAELALFPIAAYGFSLVSFAGFILNFFAIPLMTCIQIAGLAAVALDPLHLGLGRVAGWAAHLASIGLVESTRLLDVAPWLALRIPAPALGVVAAYYGAWIGWLIIRRPYVVRLACVTLIATATVWIFLAPANAGPLGAGTGHPLPGFGPAITAGRGSLSVVFLDVGQGDAIIVRFPNRRSLLVDAGGVPGGFDIGARVVSPALWALGVRHLDYLALTHGDPDHIGGALAVIRDFRPAEVWEGVPVPRHNPMRVLADAGLAVGATWRVLQSGDSMRLGGASLDVSHPPPPDWERQKVRNDDSLVFEVRLGRVSILLTGDIGRDVERMIAPHLASAALRIVKAPHHGSGTSSSREFIAATRPAAVLISAGRANRYGHPLPSVLQRYRAAGAAIFRTDQDGAVSVETDGRQVWIRTMTGRELTLGTGG